MDLYSELVRLVEKETGKKISKKSNGKNLNLEYLKKIAEYPAKQLVANLVSLAKTASLSEEIIHLNSITKEDMEKIVDLSLLKKLRSWEESHE